MDKVRKKSTPEKVTDIGRIERFQIDAIKFERTQIHFLNDVFTECRRRCCLSSLRESLCGRKNWGEEIKSHILQLMNFTLPPKVA